MIFTMRYIMINLIHRHVTKINVPRTICSFLFGKRHARRHQMVVGVIIMGAGVTVAHAASWFDHTPIVGGLLDGLGYGIHGIGLTPFIEWFGEIAAVE